MDASRKLPFSHTANAYTLGSQGQDRVDNDADNGGRDTEDGTGDILSGAHTRAMARRNAADGDWQPDPSVSIDVSDVDDGDDVDDPVADHKRLSDEFAYLCAVAQDEEALGAPEVSQLRAALKTALDDYEKMIQQARRANHDYFPQEFATNFVSGASAFLLCFGAGTLTSSALGEPAFGWALSTAMWALTERFIPMTRNTSWNNPHADTTYPLLGNLIQSAARDAVRKCAGIALRHANRGNKEPSFDDINFMKAWRGRMITDDLPYYFYTLCYGLRYTIVAGMNLPPTSAASLVSLLAAGTLAGAFTAVTMQYTRRQRYEPGADGNQFTGQTLTKTLGMWQKEVEILEVSKQLLIKVGSADLATQQTVEKKLNWRKQYKQADAILEKARQKANGASSIWFELTAMFGLKRNTGDRRGEVAGKLSEFIAGLLAKGSVLGLSTGWNYAFTMKMMAATTSVARKAQVMWGQYAVLIVAFNFRKEFELVYRGVLGLGLGMADVLLERCGGGAPTNTDEENVDREFQQNTGTLNSIGSTQDLLADYLQQNRKNKRGTERLGSMDGTDNDGAKADHSDSYANNDVEVISTIFEENSPDGERSSHSALPGRERNRTSPSTSLHGIQPNASADRNRDAIETADSEFETTFRSNKSNSKPAVKKLDISSSSSEHGD